MPKPIDLLQPARPATLRTVRQMLDQARRDNVTYFPSPVDWRDEVLYFLLPDRFSDGEEAARPLLTRDDIHTLRKTSSFPQINWGQWAESGLRWQGGTINGIRSKLDYLQQLGITCIWIAPLYKQRVRKDTYHGYGIQDFLDVDPRFGSRRDLIELVSAAHDRGMRIILDVIINHSGDNWAYIPPGAAAGQEVRDPFYKPFPDFYGNPGDPQMKDWSTAWRNAAERPFHPQGEGALPLDEGALPQSGRPSLPDDGVWPRELQDFNSYTRAGKGSLDDNDLNNPSAEHKRTDFGDLKDFALNNGQTFSFLCDCFKYWIALTDADGFRIDTVKHISKEEARNFCGAILEFAESIGKRNFFLVGEIAGGDGNQDFIMNYMELVQRNLRAALDIGSDRIMLTNIGKGLEKAGDYFDGFAEESKGFASHRSFGSRHVSILNDHDHVSGDKLRFSTGIPDGATVKDYQVTVPTAIQLLTLGIPCIYYGTEQAFSGPPQSQQIFLPEFGTSDRYLREAMFGPQHPRAVHTQDMDTQLQQQDQSLPGFGAFGVSGKHVFDPSSPAYVRIAALTKVRAQHLVLRVGRQYKRQVRVFGDFVFPPAGELVAWSRILDDEEAVCIVNPNGGEGAVRGGDVVVARELNEADAEFMVVANTAHTMADAAGVVYTGTHPIGSRLQVQGMGDSQPAYLMIRGVAPAETLVLVKA
jgi:glycosidase